MPNIGTKSSEILASIELILKLQHKSITLGVWNVFIFKWHFTLYVGSLCLIMNHNDADWSKYPVLPGWMVKIYGPAAAHDNSKTVRADLLIWQSSLPVTSSPSLPSSSSRFLRCLLSKHTIHCLLTTNWLYI